MTRPGRLWAGVREWIARGRGALGAGRSDADVRDELRLHIELAEVDARQSNSPAHPRRGALTQTAGFTQALEAVRDQQSVRWFDDLAGDIPIGCRMLAARPGFAVVAVLTLALGIGANTAMFTIADGLLLRPPPFDHPERFYWIYDVNEKLRLTSADTTPPSPANFLDWRTETRAFDAMVAWRNWWFSVAEAGKPGQQGRPAEQVRGVTVSPAFFDMLGVGAALGRTFRPDEEQPGRDGVVVLADGFWRRRFGGDPNVVGTTLLVDGQPRSIIGVLPKDFYFLWSDSAMFMPMTVDGDFRSRRASHSIVVIGRLAAGTGHREAEADLARVSRNLGRAYPSTNDGWSAAIVPVFPLNKTLQPAVLMLLGAVGCVLLIACINVTGLLLVRAGARQREMATRAALGATRGRLIRQMLTESAVLAGLGAAGGIALAAVSLRLLAALLPQVQVARPAAIAIDSRVLLFALGITLITAMAMGLVPALRASRTETLRVSAQSSRRAIPRSLLVVQIAASLVLVVSAALLVRTLRNLQQVDLGFRSDRLLTMQLWLPPAKYPTLTAVSGFYQEVLRRVQRFPEVETAAVVNTRPFLGWSLGARVHLPDHPDDTQDPIVGLRIISTGYFAALGTPLRRGRLLSDDDGPRSAGAALINEAMARRFWPTSNPIGKTIEAHPLGSPAASPWWPDQLTNHFTIVGVVGDIKENRLSERVDPVIYLSSLQNASRYAHLLVKTRTTPANAIGLVQREISAIDPELGVYGVQTMDMVLGEAIAAPRLNSVLLWAFAILALVLSAVGIYGVMSYAVAQRRHEFAVRLAMGARSLSLFRIVTQDGLTIAAAGIALGLAGALALARGLSGLLYGVAPTDSTTLAGSALTMTVVTLVACWHPAWSASRVDPARVLRSE